MDIIRGNKVRFNTPKDVYQITVETSSTDPHGNDFEHHSFKLKFPNTEDGLSQMREAIIALECCSKQYEDGKGIDDGYDRLPFFNRRLAGRWHESDFGVGQDLFNSYKVRYYDEDGDQYKMSVTNDDEMIETITNCEVRSSN